MGTKSVVAIAVVALIGLFALPLWAQGPWGGPGYGPKMGPGGQHSFQDAKKTTITGTVEELDAPFVTLKSGKETHTVFAGPVHAWFNEGFAVSKGDRVKVEAVVISRHTSAGVKVASAAVSRTTLPRMALPVTHTLDTFSSTVIVQSVPVAPGALVS